MTVQDLDRLVTKTDLTPASKKMLRHVRQAVMSGVISDPQVGSASWSISMDTAEGHPVRMSFSFKRV